MAQIHLISWQSCLTVQFCDGAFPRPGWESGLPCLLRASPKICRSGWKLVSLWLNWVPLESSCLVRIVQFSQTPRSFVYPFTPAFLFFLSFFFLFFPPNFFPFLISRYLTFRFVFSKPTKVESIAWCLITLFAAQNVRFGFVCRRASAFLSFFSSVRMFGTAQIH